MLPGTLQDVWGLFRRRIELRFRRWISRRIPPASSINLTQNNIFILPSRQGVVFLVLLGLMFIGAINYEASLAFAVVFLLLGMFLLSIFYTFRNLSGLRISARNGAPVFAGEKAEYLINLRRPGKRAYEALTLRFHGSAIEILDMVELSENSCRLYLATDKRGPHKPGRLRIETSFPFGLCRAWSLLDMNLSALVYPKPVACDLKELGGLNAKSGRLFMNNAGEDFYSLREYQRGDSLHHVAWKVFARGRGMYTKQFAEAVSDNIWLHWDFFPGLGIEERLSRLCYCALQLEQKSMDYGLALPGQEIKPARGREHLHQVLEALALFRIDDGERDE